MSKHHLYGGRVILDFDPKKHIYYRMGVKQLNVSRVLDTIAKNGLMGYQWGQAKAFLAKNIGKEITEELLAKAGRKSYDKSQRARLIGKEVHKHIEEETLPEKKHGQVPIWRAVKAYRKFKDDWDIRPMMSERPVYSRTYKIAGTFDQLAWVGKHEGNFIIDYKTSSAIYPEYAVQLGAYYDMFKEEFPTTDIAGVMVVRLPKKKGEEYEVAMFSGRARLFALQTGWRATISLHSALKHYESIINGEDKPDDDGFEEFMETIVV